MPISLEMMKEAARSGLSVVCASCELYWEARDKGILGDRCLAHDGCGSPLANGTFHEYRGPLTEDALKRFCFVCGSPAAKGLRRTGDPRMIGVCEEHFEWMNDPAMRRPLPADITDKEPKNYLGIDPKDLNGHQLPREHSLLGTILKTEKEWADRAGYEFDAKKLLGLDEGDDD